MNEWAILDLVVYFAGSVIALVQSIVFAHYFRLFRRDHLLLWSYSFLALAIYLTAAGTAWLLVSHLAAAHPLRLGLTCLSLIAAYSQVAALIMGTLAIWRTQQWTRKQILRALAVASVLGLVSALAFAFDPSMAHERLFMRVGLRYLIAGLAALVMGIAIASRWPRGRLGQQLTAIALSLYGIDQLQVFASYLRQASGYEPWPWSLQIGILSLVTPLFIGYGLVIWLLENERDRAELATDAAERLRLFDQLTGLPNRSQMLGHIERQMQHDQGAALLLIRLDNLGNIAVAAGINGVDVALAISAERIENVARANGMVAARPGADHIAVHGSGFGTGNGVQRIAEEILTALALPMFSNGHELALEASLGIALAPRDASSAEALQSHAEMARARAQSEGAMRYRFYAPDIEAEAQARLQLQSELRTAFLNEEFVLEFQPILDGWSLEICGFEALVRWQHPQRGRLLPDTFIAELEPLGLVETLDAWVLEQACSAAVTWQRPDREALTIAVNVSAYSFQRRRFPDHIKRLLERTGLEPACLEIEIIESIALQHPEHAANSIERLREIGVRVMLDDFGTGFSSLKNLRQLPFDGLKIDHSFVVDVLIDSRDAAIVRAMLALAHSLGLEVVAEGIETPAQLAWFQSAGCDRLQGFHFHRSMTQEAVLNLLGITEKSPTQRSIPVT
ncbi:MAG TPA: GGDEF domain-containing phosphodiesterase [Dokdonella sp.]|uniref:putative bifunctional diguanylate cyclase/phosphodiesterase n=1 Tax=Dokdonella sp. TaxID=2291710 RepID=UPI002D7EBE93|nr:GGDEF domain-containing phosphodiesterase [Dokdonella sp.]HET9033306.1 GGDEF domain-containing phosphodiesterase [Dokdonella sp.]